MSGMHREGNSRGIVRIGVDWDRGLEGQTNISYAEPDGRNEVGGVCFYMRAGIIHMRSGSTPGAEWELIGPSCSAVFQFTGTCSLLLTAQRSGQ